MRSLFQEFKEGWPDATNLDNNLCLAYTPVEYVQY